MTQNDDDDSGIKPGSWQAEAWEHFKAFGNLVAEALSEQLPEGFRLVWNDEKDESATQGPEEAAKPPATGWKGLEPTLMWQDEHAQPTEPTEPPAAGSRPRADGGVDRGVPVTVVRNEVWDGEQWIEHPAPDSGRWVSNEALRRTVQTAERRGAAVARSADRSVDTEQMRAADRLIGAQAFVRWLSTQVVAGGLLEQIELGLDTWRRVGGHQVSAVSTGPDQDPSVDVTPETLNVQAERFTGAASLMGWLRSEGYEISKSRHRGWSGPAVSSQVLTNWARDTQMGTDQ